MMTRTLKPVDTQNRVIPLPAEQYKNKIAKYSVVNYEDQIIDTET